MPTTATDDPEVELAVARHRVAVLQRELADRDRALRALEAHVRAVAKMLRPYTGKNGGERS
jgi:hypothetical protein